jgi:hypothetical protein
MRIALYDTPVKLRSLRFQGARKASLRYSDSGPPAVHMLMAYEVLRPSLNELRAACLPWLSLAG